MFKNLAILLPLPLKKILFRSQKDNVLLSEFFDDITISAQVGQGKDGNQLGAQSGA